MSARGKRYASARSQVDRERVYSPLEAIRLLKELAARPSSTRPSRHISGSDSTFATPTSSCAER